MSSFDTQLASRPDSHESRQTGIDDRTPALKRTVHGMIDYDFYLERSRRMRGEATNSFFRTVGGALRRAVHGRAKESKPARSARQAHSGAGFTRPVRSHL